MIKGVISDFFGVLTTPLIGGFGRAMTANGLSIETLGHAMVRATEVHGENPLFDLERGRLSEGEFFALLNDGIEAEVGRRVELRDFAEHYFSSLAPNQPLFDHLGRVRDERGLRLALLTNNVREWEARWRSMLPIDELFDVVVDSAFVGLRKPEPRIYELTLERLGLAAGECVFIDDLEINCVTAREVGIAAIHFRTTDEAIRELDAVLDGAAAG